MLRTKAAVSIDEMGDQYCMIGPYVEKGVKMEVEVEDPVKHEPMATIVRQMKEYGFKVSIQSEYKSRVLKNEGYTAMASGASIPMSRGRSLGSVKNARGNF